MRNIDSPLPATPTIQVIERMMTLMDVLASQEEAISLKEISAKTGLHPSTAHRILNDLVLGRFVDHPQAGSYRLGMRLLELGNLVKARLDVRMLPDEDTARFLEEVRKVINDPQVTARYTADNTRPAGIPAQIGSDAFRAIESAVARDYDSVSIPMMGTGATDMAQVRSKGVQCYGIGAATDIEDVPKGFGAHSDQERIIETELHRFVRFSYDIIVSLSRSK